MRSVVDSVLRAVSGLFHLGLGLFLVVLALVALLGPEATFTLGILPFEGRSLAWILLGTGVVSLVAVYLAIRRLQPLLLLLWSVTVLGVLAYGCFLGRYYFGRDGPGLALQLAAAAALATVGSWRALRRKDRSRPVVGRFEDAAG